MSPVNMEEIPIKSIDTITAGSSETGGSDKMAGWYVVQVISGQEHIVRKLILKRFSAGDGGDGKPSDRNPSEVPKGQQESETLFKYPVEECFIPMRERRIKYKGEWQLVKERIFPGYVFVVTRSPEQVFQSLKQIPRFTSLLGQTDAGFIALSEQEIHFLKRFGDSEHVSHLSQVTVEPGNRVRILDGDLLNYEGEIVKINLHKRVAIVRVPFMGSSVDIHLGIEIVEKIAF